MEDKYSSNVLSGGKLGMVEVPNSRYVSCFQAPVQLTQLPVSNCLSVVAIKTNHCGCSAYDNVCSSHLTTATETGLVFSSNDSSQ